MLNSKKSIAALVVIIGFVYLSIVFGFASKADFDATKHDMQSTIRYVDTQYREFHKLDSASKVKSLMSVTATTEQIIRNLELNKGRLSEELLADYVRDYHLSGIIVLDSKGSLICEYNNDRYGFAALRYELLKPSVMDVTIYPEKIFSDHLQLNDGSHIDLSVTSRQDAPGVVVCYYHTPAEYAASYNMSLYTLLSGYSIQSSGTIIISDGNKVIASNDASILGSRVEDNDIVQALKQDGRTQELIHIKDSKANNYYGSMERGRNYFIYVYMPEQHVYTTRMQKTMYAFVVYLLIVGGLLVFRARTEKRYLEQQREHDEMYKEQLREAVRAAEKANKAKTEFLQRMSHDIRTPINGIRGFIEMGNYHKDDLAKQAEYREKIWQSSGFLLDLVNEVLEMGKLSSGEIQMEEIPFNLREICDEVKSIVMPQAQEKGVEFIVKKDELPYPCLIGSPVHVKRILLNIVGNAVKYNKNNGRVYITLVESKTDDETMLVEFKCEDTGIGISKRFLPHVFDAFAQDSDIARSSYEGTGLGMPIAKSLVDKMGGTLEVESEKGIGTTFTMRIPFKKAAEQPSEEQKQEAPDIELVKGMHVLLAEDNKLNMEIAQFFLNTAGITSTSVQNGKEAVEAFEDSAVHEYDAVLMDIMMPFMNGMEATQKIRALEREDAGTVPIIAMTANAFVEDKKQAMAAGMTDYITKPLQMDLLLHLLAKYAKKRKH
ncbi:ATP-binding protein [Phascolarctobacterium succinatutens]|uniref:ATP-binding protein n=1 Tax=Phascolarctobacterium succinatutens TaxID=626940 RepID=UPI0026F0946E|nr:ATP-binding protein [Phascolarctobacterium succinatutens]